jgi:Phosphoesterase family
MSERLNPALFSVTIVALTSCSFSSPPRSPQPGSAVVPAVRSALPAPRNPLKHIIVVVQENRSFDNIFAGFPGADAPTFGYDSSGGLVPLRPKNFTGPDLAHTWQMALTEWDQGKMDGFNLEQFGDRFGGAPAGTYTYAYIDRSIVKPYWTMAQRYVLADHMFHRTPRLDRRYDGPYSRARRGQHAVEYSLGVRCAVRDDDGYADVE